MTYDKNSQLLMRPCYVFSLVFWLVFWKLFLDVYEGGKKAHSGDFSMYNL